MQGTLIQLQLEQAVMVVLALQHHQQMAQILHLAALPQMVVVMAVVNQIILTAEILVVLVVAVVMELDQVGI
ncbi:MAG: hypothetical protein EBS89_00185 [Proteobacteria bacterium]|nr:hypothetical protein [Pseudomonadota bacterium]